MFLKQKVNVHQNDTYTNLKNQKNHRTVNRMEKCYVKGMKLLVYNQGVIALTEKMGFEFWKQKQRCFTRGCVEVALHNRHWRMGKYTGARWP